MPGKQGIKYLPFYGQEGVSDLQFVTVTCNAALSAQHIVEDIVAEFLGADQGTGSAALVQRNRVRGTFS